MAEFTECVNSAAVKAIGTVLIDNARTRVTEWAFSKKGDNTGWHIHEYDYVVIPMFSGSLIIDNGNEKVTSSLNEGVPYFRAKGVEHDVINDNDFPCKFIEVEFLNSC